MKRLRVFRRTITITSTETWTVSVESNQPLDPPRPEDRQPARDDAAQLGNIPNPIQATGQQLDGE